MPSVREAIFGKTALFLSLMIGASSGEAHCVCASSSCAASYEFHPSAIFNDLNDISRDTLNQPDQVPGLQTADEESSLAQHWKCHHPFLTPMFGADAASHLVAEVSTMPRFGSVYVGVSGWYNYDFMAARHSPYAILADLSICVVKLHLVTGDVIRNSKDRFHFVRQMQKMLQENPCISDRTRIENLLHQPSSWLNRNESFSHIKQMFDEGRVYPLQIDLLNPDALERIAVWLKKTGLTVDTLYLANMAYIWGEVLNVVTRRHVIRRKLCTFESLCRLNDFIWGEDWIDYEARQLEKTGLIASHIQNDINNEVSLILKGFAKNHSNPAIKEDVAVIWEKVSPHLMALSKIIDNDTWVIDQFHTPWRIEKGRGLDGIRYHPDVRIRDMIN